MHFIPFIIAVLFQSFINPGHEEKTMLFCQCVFIHQSADNPELDNRDMYTFLVMGKDGRDCCIEDPLAGYSGWFERYTSENPQRKTMWVQEKALKTEMTAVEAQQVGCNAENHEILVTYLREYPETAKKYYPDLKIED